MSAADDSHASLPVPSVPARRRWPTVALALAIFAAGAVCGAGAAVLVIVNRVQHAIHHPETAPSRLATLLQRRLDLDDDQRAKVEALIAARQQEIAAVRRRFQPEIEGQFDQFRTDVDALLTDPQRDVWHAAFEKFRTRWLPPAHATSQ
jgi:hypothetical protein